MKSQTLRHLMLLSGKSIAVDTTNEDIKERIFQVCDSLQITRERKSPFQLKFKLNGQAIEKSVSDDLFTFHVRGDVPSRLHLTKDRDIRKENWTQAIQLWREILGVEQLGDSTRIAPIHRSHARLTASVRLAQAALLLAGIIGTVAINEKTALSLVPLLLLALLPAARIKNEYLLSVVIAVISIGGSSIHYATAGILVYVAIEAMTAIVTNKHARLIALAVSFIGTIFFGNGLTTNSSSTGSYLVSILWIAFAVGMFPRNVSGDLSRSSIPLSVAFLLVTTDSNYLAGLAALLVAIAPTINWGKKTSELPQLTSVEVPVSVRKK